MSSALKDWMRLATTYEQNRLAALAKTSRSYLYDIAGGKRNASSDTAAAIEVSSRILHRESKRFLPILYRSSLSKACGACPYAPKCKKKVTK